MSPKVTDAVILAAGVGERLHPATGGHPKALLRLGGRTLMERHLDHLAAGGVERAHIVVGHRADLLREKFGSTHGDLEIRYVMNPEYERGSVLSLRKGLRSLGAIDARVVWMDADVLYHPDVLHRLLASEPPFCFLLDATAKESGEEMMLGVEGDRVLHIDRGVGAGGWDQTGESVGFFAVNPEPAAKLLATLDRFAETGRLDAEYEEAVHEILPEIQAGYVEVGDLPWTEIDFPEDVERAEQILRLIESP